MRNKIRQTILLLSLIIPLSATGLYAALTTTVDFGDDLIYGSIESKVESDLNSELARYSDMSSLARGFGNANTYASNVATMKGYQDFELFSFTVGTIVTAQAPDSDAMFYKKLQDELDNGDIYAGMGANPLVFQAGMNLGFIVPGLYVSLRFGKLDIEYNSTDYNVNYDSNLMGALVDYRIISEKTLLARSIVWRGLTAEAGFMYSKNKVIYFKELDTITADDGFTTAKVDPSVDFEIDITSYIIPVEIYTSLRILYVLNIGAGIGLDYVPGNTTDLYVHSAGDAEITLSSAAAVPGKKGTIDIKADSSAAADTFRVKFSANIGLQFGPVIIDVPVTYYLDNGYAAGISAGFVW